MLAATSPSTPCTPRRPSASERDEDLASAAAGSDPRGHFRKICRTDSSGGSFWSAVAQSCDTSDAQPRLESRKNDSTFAFRLHWRESRMQRLKEGTVVPANKLPVSLLSIAGPVIAQYGSPSGGTVVSDGSDGRKRNPKRSREERDEGMLAWCRDEGDDRRNKRRGRDDDRRGGRDFGAKEAGYRITSYLCYAYSVATGRWYVGYSGGGGAFSRALSSQADLDRRNHRVDHVLEGTVQRTRNDITNCAEVSALNVALSYGESAADLIFITWRGANEGGRLVDPCANCIQWIVRRCFGYFNGHGFHPGRRGG